MHTARSLTVSPSMLCSGGGGGFPVLGGCLPGLGGSGPGGVSAWLGGMGCLPGLGGCLPGPGGGSLVPGEGITCLVPGGCLSGPGGVVVSQHALRQTPPVNRITDACENITLPQLRCGR